MFDVPPLGCAHPDRWRRRQRRAREKWIENYIRHRKGILCVESNNKIEHSRRMHSGKRINRILKNGAKKVAQDQIMQLDLRKEAEKAWEDTHPSGTHQSPP